MSEELGWSLMRRARSEPFKGQGLHLQGGTNSHVSAASLLLQKHASRVSLQQQKKQQASCSMHRSVIQAVYF